MNSTNSATIHPERLSSARDRVAELLLAQRHSAGHWEGELSSSPLSTATACLAFKVVLEHASFLTVEQRQQTSQAINSAIDYLLKLQNPDGGFGDTSLSISNISTSMLCSGTLQACKSFCESASINLVIEKLEHYVTKSGGVQAVVKRYGKDKTFSVPILTHCAIAGIVDWKQVSQLPFELSCFPAEMYAAMSLPVVSYALPALIAIGNVKFHKSPYTQWWMTPFRIMAVGPSLKKLISIQPENGGFLEATPLTSFVTMSLASAKLADHPVVIKGMEFLLKSQRPDGSWAIDTNLATWVTTLSINSMSHSDLEKVDVPYLIDWLLNQQYKTKHPYTNAAPGGWAWTNLPGGVPDADDTPGAMLALIKLRDYYREKLSPAKQQQIVEAIHLGGLWLTGLQNSDGGFPTFCRGWGNLPFDRSANDITAHCIRALDQTNPEKFKTAITRGVKYLVSNRKSDGSWLPLWFGNQFNHADENPVFGTARVLKAFKEVPESAITQQAVGYLLSQQNEDGGWGGAKYIESSVEETALACDALLEFLPVNEPHLVRGINWLIEQITNDNIERVTPIGFYFAKLWYYEKLYPLIFTLGALNQGTNKVFGS